MYTAKQIQQTLSCPEVNHPESRIDQLSTDSRKITSSPSCLFFAIKSEKNDGHNYLEELYGKGVRNFVVSESRSFSGSENCNFFKVDDAVSALQTIATDHRKKYSLPVIAITGSNGKTIVKEWLWQLLGNDFNTVRSPKSYNSQVGVPLSVWKITENHNLGVFEAGISKPGEMVKLEEVILPTIGVFTNIGQAHEKNFSSEGEKIREKLKLFKNCETVILPADDEKIVLEWMKTGFTGNVIGWSYRKKGNLNLRKTPESNLICQWKGTEFEVVPPFKDEASLENLSVCIAIALQLGVDYKKIIKRVSLLTQVGMRLEMLEGVNNSLLINDSYSADLSSLQIALDFLEQQNQHKSKTLIVSDILEAGTEDEALYARIASLCKEKVISRLIGVGPKISSFKNLFPAESEFYPTTDAFLKQLNPTDFADQSILIKGARIFSFERITNILQRKAHETVLEINLNAIAQNLNYFSSVLEGKKMMIMVKAAAYGSGNVEIAKLVEYNRVDYLGVAYINEGIDLRKAGVKTPIMVMNPDPEHFSLLVKNNLEPEIFNFSGLQAFATAIEKAKLKTAYPFHLKIDTGMHRLGFNLNELDALIDFLKNHPIITPASVFSHLSSADDPQWDEFTQHQISVFKAATEKLEAELGKTFIKHIANTAGAIRFKEAGLDMVRLGIGLYGVATIPEVANHLIPTGQLKTHISQIRNINAGETVGYSRKHKATENQTIATVPIGYADGLPRKLGNGNYQLLVDGKKAPIVGNVCMDMCMIDVTGISCQEGDEVIVFGPDLPIEIMANKLETIPYEVLTGISTRVKRVFYQE